jgi:hypothetical protein
MELIGVFDERDEAKVVTMPLADESLMATFLRYHVLVRVYDGDADAWLAHLTSKGGDAADMRFVRSVRVRLRRDPRLMETIRRMVDQTPFWSAAQA